MRIIDIHACQRVTELVFLKGRNNNHDDDLHIRYDTLTHSQLFNRFEFKRNRIIQDLKLLQSLFYFVVFLF